MRIGFIGMGNMGTALLKTIINAKLLSPKNIFVYDISHDKLNKLKNELYVNISANNKSLVDNSDIIILAVKPNIYDTVLREIKDLIDNNKIIITIAPGISIEHVRNIVSKGKIVRTIPNTPALIGEGITAITYSNDFSDENKKIVQDIFKSCGEIVEIDEKLIDIAMAVSSCSPAFVYMFIEAIADAGVSLGLTRDIAYKLASKAVSGSGSMVLKTGMHPGQLKDMVTSPAGTTIQGVRTLEKYGMRSAVIEAIIASYEKVKSLK